MRKQSVLTIAGAAVFSCFAVHAQAAFLVRPNDLSGAWYDPNTSGQGFMFDVSSNADGSVGVFGGWFTFTLSGMLNEAYPTWFSIQGQISSTRTASPISIFHTGGGTFDAPPVVAASLAGSGTLAFLDCTHATFTYSIAGEYLNSPAEAPPLQTGSISLVRLSAEAGCNQPSAEPTSSRGFSGTWYNPTTSGQGLLFDVSDTGGGFFFGGWFTYADVGAYPKAWYTLQGPFATNATEADLPVYVGRSESFGSTQVPAPGGELAIRQVGTAHIKFTSCTDAQLDYTVTFVGTPTATGSIPLKRLTPVPADCALR